MSRPARHAAMLQVIGWLVERHHQSLGLWPWTWTGPEGEPYVTLYARCAGRPFGDEFGALANWLEANRWPPPDGRPYPATFYRDRLNMPAWAWEPPMGLPEPTSTRRAAWPDLEALVRSGSSIETAAQLLESASHLDSYLATLAPLRHGDHPHRGAAGRMAVLVMRLATEAALALDEDYAVPWTGPVGGHVNGISDPDWRAFTRRYRLEALPFPTAAPDVFTFGDRGWLHASGWVGDRRGNALRLGGQPLDDEDRAALLALTLRLLGHASA